MEKTDVAVIEFEKEHKDVYRYLSKHTGGNITQSRTINLRQYLFAQVNNVSFPCKVKMDNHDIDY